MREDQPVSFICGQTNVTCRHLGRRGCGGGKGGDASTVSNEFIIVALDLQLRVRLSGLKGVIL